jgi:hypothetical protein
MCRKSLIYCFTCILSSWSSPSPSFGQYSRKSWWWILWLKFHREMFFTAGFSAKLPNLVLQLSEQQKSLGSYLAQYPFLHSVFYERSHSRELFPIGSGVPRNFVRGGSTNWVEDRGQRERGSGGGSPLVRGSGVSCNLYFRLVMMTTNLFVIVNVKQLWTEGVLEFYYLFPSILGCWCPKFSNF